MCQTSSPTGSRGERWLSRKHLESEVLGHNSALSVCDLGQVLLHPKGRKITLRGTKISVKIEHFFFFFGLYVYASSTQASGAGRSLQVCQPGLHRKTVSNLTPPKFRKF